MISIAFGAVFQFNPSPDDDGQPPKRGAAASDDGTLCLCRPFDKAHTFGRIVSFLSVARHKTGTWLHTIKTEKGHYTTPSSRGTRTNEWASGQKQQRATRKNLVPIVVPGLATVSSRSSASSSSSSLPQDTSGDVLSSPATQRSDDTNAQPSRNRSRNPTKTKNKNEDNIQASRNRLRDLPHWSVEFAENLEDKEEPAVMDTPANTSQDSDSERPAKVVSRKHSIHIPERPKLQNLQANQDYMGSLQEAH